MISVEFKFNIDDKVTLREINRPGVVERLMLSDTGQKFDVCYWHDGKRCNEWVYEYEIELRKI